MELMSHTSKRVLLLIFTPSRNSLFAFRKILWLLMCVLLVELGGGRSLAQPISGIEVLEDGQEEKALIRRDQCTFSLERRKKEPGLFHFRYHHTQSLIADECHRMVALEDKLEVLEALIVTLVPEPHERNSIHTLFAGRLVKTFPELAKRIALAAAISEDWDDKRAWKESGYANRSVRHWFMSPDVHRELADMLERLGFRIRSFSVEKVLMAKPQDIPFGDKLLEEGANPNSKLPFDAMTWVILEPLGKLEKAPSACKDQ